MFWFWLIFFLISFYGLLSYKKEVPELAKAWGEGNRRKMEALLPYINFLIAFILTVIGIFGMLGFIQIR
jgi:hypothetical protein